MSTNQSSKRPEIITIRVKDTELKWRLKSAAAEHRTTVSALIEQFLNDGLNNLGGKDDTGEFQDNEGNFQDLDE